MCECSQSEKKKASCCFFRSIRCYVLSVPYISSAFEKCHPCFPLVMRFLCLCCFRSVQQTGSDEQMNCPRAVMYIDTNTHVAVVGLNSMFYYFLTFINDYYDIKWFSRYDKIQCDFCTKRKLLDSFNCFKY